MDADRVRSYLQVACAGLGFDIGEVWWMSNESGTSTVAAIEEKNGHESDSSGEDAYNGLMNQRGSPTKANGSKRRTPKKRFLQLYTSKAYCNQRSKLVQPHDNENGTGSPPVSNPGSPSSNRSSSKQLTLRRTSSAASLELDREHVLSPRIVEAVTHSTQVVWANCQKTEGLLGRSDIKLQTAIGMPVGVDESGNVWVVVMFSPKNVESSTDAIDYLQYISRSAASTSIPCLLPVVGDADPPSPGRGGNKMICNGDDPAMSNGTSNGQGNHLHHSHSLVSIKTTKQPDHTQELGDGVTAKFVSFNLNDDDDLINESKNPNQNKSSGQHNQRPLENDLRTAPKDDFGIPMLPDTSNNPQTTTNSNNTHQYLLPDAIDSAITDAFDEASYGVWSTIMNSAGGNEAIRTAESIATKMHLIQERLEEFATAFLGMSVFDVADAWTISTTDKVLKCLFTVAATETNRGINALRDASATASVRVGDGAVGKAYSSGYPVWSSVKELIYDRSREHALQNCKIETAFAVPIFSAGEASPSCILSCYSLLPAESVPFVLNFVQKAVRLLWSGLDRVVNPHQSVGRELWKDVGPADLGEMAADMEMQKAFIGKKRPRSASLAQQQLQREVEKRRAPLYDNTNGVNNNNSGNITEGPRFSFVESEYDEAEHRDRSTSLAAQMKSLPSLAPTPAPATQALDAATSPWANVPVNAPPSKGMAPAPLLPNTVQERSPNAQQFVFLDTGDDGHWAVQQAVQSVGEVQLWNNGAGSGSAINGSTNGFLPGNQYGFSGAPHNQHYQQQQNQPPPSIQQQQHPHQHKMSYVNYSPNKAAVQQHGPRTAAAYPPAGVHTDDPATIHANLMEFNALAQMHSLNNAAPATPAAPTNTSILNGTNHALPTQTPTNQPVPTNINLDKMVVIPISQAEGSVILTGPQQSMMYCTTRANAASVTTQPTMVLGTQAMDPSMFALDDSKPFALRDAVELLLQNAPIVPNIAVTVNARGKVVPNVRKVPHAFASHTEEAGDAHSQDATKVLVTSISVQPMEEANAAKKKDATSLPLAVLISAQAMAEANDARCQDVISQRSPPPNFASSTVGVRSVSMMGAKRLQGVGLCIALRMVVVYDVN
eukprot:CAMPEP_0183733490 /NCGR_PEP_ID=MMETSP0737-20130205/41341_1 /TAXON_ID=385413 /ORGANISM="Thalassiosira miniscula, Strain CCMP1093" /LENGTH=1113 /DNA_ID=CAMNT_0025966757 /DNA_START=284 /DNA_END=3626 /DNA_ORIENTATION=+